LEVNIGYDYDSGGLMGTPSLVSAEKDFERARMELGKGNTLAALACLEKALKASDNPGWYSSLGYCVAKERGQFTRGLELCRSAIENEPLNTDHYLFLGKVHLVAGNKKAGLEVLRKGVELGGSPEITKLFDELGTRKPPVVGSLRRCHPINRYLGIILRRLGLR
jgi:tetratricopeptide (TPR) repeat protein